MKAFITDRYGKKDPMCLGDMPQPELRDDDVLRKAALKHLAPA